MGLALGFPFDVPRLQKRGGRTGHPNARLPQPRLAASPRGWGRPEATSWGVQLMGPYLDPLSGTQ